jgi:hypothetical protein
MITPKRRGVRFEYTVAYIHPTNDRPLKELLKV